MDKKISFEEGLARLEEISEILEEGSVPLEQSVTFYEEGMKLMSLLKEQLQEAKGRVVLLSEKDGEISYKSFGEQE